MKKSGNSSSGSAVCTYLLLIAEAFKKLHCIDSCPI